MRRTIEKGILIFILGIGLIGGYNLTINKAAEPIVAYQVADKDSVYYNDTITVALTATNIYFEEITNLSFIIEVPEELMYESHSATDVTYSSDNYTHSYLFDQIAVGENLVISAIYRVISREVKIIEFKPSNISFQLLNGIRAIGSTNALEINLRGIKHQLSAPIIIFPNSTAVKGPIILIEWKIALDTLDHNVTYAVYYSTNNGTMWIELVSGIATTSYSWNTTSSPKDLSYLIKVLATCSYGETSEDMSDTHFTIENDISKTTTTADTPGLTIMVLFGALMILRKARKKKTHQT